MATLLGNQIASNRAKISFFLLRSAIFSPLSPWTWAMVKAYQLPVYMFSPQWGAEVKAKGQLCELR